MKYTRSQIRHACYRAKNDAVTDEQIPILEHIEQFLKPEHKWDRFNKTWDIVVDDQTGDIVIIKPEDDYNYIHSTCLEAKILSRKNMSFDDMTDRQKNIIKIIDSHMLGGLMAWEEYGETWKVEVDKDIKQITTKMNNVKSNQIEVTDEMIERSKVDPNDLPEQLEVSEMEHRDATPEEIEKIRKRMAEMGVDTPEPKIKKTAKKKSKKRKTKKTTSKRATDVKPLDK